MDLYFECNSGISGDMSVAALLDLGADKEKLDNALKSMNLGNEFDYSITKKTVNAIMTTDFNVIQKNTHNHKHDECDILHNHEHRNLEDINKIIDKAEITDSAKNLAKRIFQIVAEAEGKVHGKNIKDVHFHEVGAIDSIIDIVSFSVLIDDLAPENIYFSVLSEGQGSVMCQHGELSVPVPAVCEIASKYEIPLKITDNNGEMVTPTGAAIVAALNRHYKLPESIIIEKIGYGAGKRHYKNPILRVMKIRTNK